MSSRNYNNTSVPQVLTAVIDDSPSSTALTVGNTSTYPSPPFILGLERGTPNQEVALCTAKPNGTTFTVIRGYDGTSPLAHLVGSTVEHTSAAIDFREANTLVLRQSQTYSVSGALAVPSGSVGFLPGFFFPVPGTQTVTLVGVRAQIHGGTSVALAVQQNGTPVSGLSALSVTMSPAFTAAIGPPSVTDGDYFAPVISSIIGAPDGLSLSFYFDITV
jgi:hypothetical protein